MDIINFEVGGKYENEKGIFEVISIDPAVDTMVIQWESGEKIFTQINFQRRVLERRHMQKKRTESNREVSCNTKFDGFKERIGSGLHF